MFQHTLYCLLESLVFAASVPFSVLTLVLASWDSWVDICWQLGGWINPIGKGHQLEFQLMIHHSFLFFSIFYEFVARAYKVATPMYCSSILGLGLGNQIVGVILLLWGACESRERLWHRPLQMTAPYAVPCLHRVIWPSNERLLRLLDSTHFAWYVYVACFFSSKPLCVFRSLHSKK
jgi:hypothetical protein